MNDRIRARLLRCAWLTVLCTVVILPGSAQEATAQLPDSLSGGARVSVLTVNPGDAIYSYWGHSALRVTDPVHGFDAVFNWGTFDPARPWFVPRFAYGDMQYELSVDPMTRFFRGANAEQRGVIEQQLNLDADRKQALWSLLLENMHPDNKAYAYDFVRDNCSTRILDLLAEVDGVVLADPSADPPTYRQMVDEFVHQEAWLDLGIDLAFGSPMDKDVQAEDRAFLPLHLLALLDGASTPEGQPLVSETRTLLDIPWQAAERDFDRVQWLFWVLFLLIIVFTGRSMRTGTFTGPEPLDRFLLGLLGFIGLFLLLMWTATLHWVTGWNADILWALPTHFVVAIWWKRAPWFATYLRISALVMGTAVLLQLTLIQPIPPAMTPLAAAAAIRFWVVGQRMSAKPAAKSVTPSAA